MIGLDNFNSLLIVRTNPEKDTLRFFIFLNGSSGFKIKKLYCSLVAIQALSWTCAFWGSQFSSVQMSRSWPV